MNSIRKPRIMQVITRLIHGGAQEVTVLIVQRLLRAGYGVVFAHGPGDESLLKRLPHDDPGFETLFVPEFRRRILPYYDFLAFLRLYNYIKKNPVDLVHTHTSKAGVIGRWAARCAGVPAIVHSPRGSIYHSTYFNEPMLQFLAAVERSASGFTDQIVTLCESEKKDYLRYRIAPPEKYTTVYSGVEIKKYVDLKVDRDAKKKSLGIQSGRPLIGYVARMTPEKAHWMAVEAFKLIKAEIPGAMLVFVGGGPLEEEVRKKISADGLEGDVALLGARTDVPEILPLFDCCIQTSVWDGLPRAMVEAMLAERPVVATAVGGVPEIIENGKSGILVPERDVQGIARGAVNLLKDPERAKEMGRNARRRMEEVFDVDKTTEKLFALYETLLKKKMKDPRLG